MWLKRLVGFVMIITCIGMVGLAVVGIFAPEKRAEIGFANNHVAEVVVPPPTVKLSAQPGSISSGGYSALTWSTTGNPSTCIASGSWTGPKTSNGAESSGRLNTIGDMNYTLTCTNEGGKAEASIKLSVLPASAPVPNSSGSSTSTSKSGPAYCGGRLPCYNAREVRGHSSAGDCWGWNGDRVINISGFDVGFHASKTGISSIEISDICGRDLAPSLRGSVPAGGQTRDHNATTKSNSDRNEIPYFVGYYDASKP